MFLVVLRKNMCWINHLVTTWRLEHLKMSSMCFCLARMISGVVKSIILSCMDQVLQKRYEQFSIIEIVEALEVMYHKDLAKVHEMIEALEECKIAEIGEQGLKLVDYYDSLNAMEIDFPKTPENDLTLTLFYEAMFKTKEMGLQNQQKLMVNKTESFKRKRNTKRNKGGVSCETICFSYKGKGHWKINCLKYLTDKKNTSSGKGIKVIQVNVIDTLLTEKFQVMGI